MNRVRPEIWRSSKRGTLVRGSLLTSFFMREFHHTGQFNDNPAGVGIQARCARECIRSPFRKMHLLAPRACIPADFLSVAKADANHFIDLTTSPTPTPNGTKLNKATTPIAKPKLNPSVSATFKKRKFATKL